MIPNNERYVAVYDTTRGLGRTRAVIAWDNEGFPMVVGGKRLIRADTLPGYEEVRWAVAGPEGSEKRTYDQLKAHRLAAKESEPKPFKSRFAALAEKHGNA